VTKHIPGKRIKTAWRNAGRVGALKTFALLQIVTNTPLAETARKWASGKVAP
jgi:hypothetical protein